MFSIKCLCYKLSIFNKYSTLPIYQHLYCQLSKVDWANNIVIYAIILLAGSASVVRLDEAC